MAPIVRLVAMRAAAEAKALGLFICAQTKILKLREPACQRAARYSRRVEHRMVRAL
jgi:hypothetical protein